METLIADPRLSQRLIDERRARGIDINDEVWEGVYVMAPAPNDEHQEIELSLSEPLVEVVKKRGQGIVRMRVNLASDPRNWERNYRIPDLIVFLNDTGAVCHDTFWSGPPDFVVEIISPGDKTRDKLEFYEKIGTRELLVVDRDPWGLELYRPQGKKMVCVSQIAPDDDALIQSEVIPLEFRLASGQKRPTILVTTTDGQRSWTI
jgi:Uma2 family endonuclease